MAPGDQTDAHDPVNGWAVFRVIDRLQLGLKIQQCSRGASDFQRLVCTHAALAT